MQNITLDTITEAVINHGDRGKSHPRLYEIYTSLVQHLHDFVREVNLTEPELQQGRDFLNQASHHTQEISAGEIHLLTDLLGISELVELLDDTHCGTESNLEGPLYVPNAPERQMGDHLGIDPAGNTLFLSGRVLNLDGEPIADALIEVWQSNSKGLYDLQDSSQPQGNFRGCFRTDASGKYTFETVVPLGYHVPTSGPSGELLRLLGRHIWRPAHIHFKLSAPQYTSLTTQIFRLCCKNFMRTENPDCKRSDYATTPKMRLTKRTRSLMAPLGTPKTCPFLIMFIISYPRIVRRAVLNEPNPTPGLTNLLINRCRKLNYII